VVVRPKERRYVGGAFIALNEKMRERLWSRVNARAKPLKGGKVKPGTQWLKPGLVGRVRRLKGEQLLRPATLREIKDE
jgi:ATP-dependent DNA ligase